MDPIAFKVRTQGRYDGSKGGAIKSGGGGAGALWYVDKTFTIATHQDQWLAVPLNLPPNHYAHPRTKAEMNTQTPIRYLSCFSGIEAASVAWEPLGFKAVGFSEIEPFPCAVLKHHFPNTPNYGDITKHTEWNIEPGSVDLLVGGSPCQAFSVAGLRKGLADPRGNLALTFLGLADRLRPKWILWENVPGVLSSNGGRDFGSFLGALGQLGYGWAYRVLDAQHFGVPQRRARVFLLATSLGDSRVAAEVLSIGEGLRGYLEASEQKRKKPAADVGTGFEADGLWKTVGTICADTHPGAYTGQDAYTGRLIPANKSDDGAQHKPIVIDRAAFNQGVNAKYEPHIEESDTMDSLVARGPHADGVSLPHPIPIHDQATRHAGKRGDNQDGKGNGLGIGKEGDPAPTLTKGDKHAVAIPFRKSKRAQSTTDDESWVEAKESNTLNNFDLGDTRTTHAVVEPTLPITFQPGNLRREAGADPSTEATTTPKASAGDQMPHIATPPPAMAVRRLTPKECERLQGFPDDWTLIPWKGKPADQCPDGPRYKACGNSMAVPCMAWIGKRLAEVHARIYPTQ